MRLADFAPFNPNAQAGRLDDIAGQEVMVADFRLQDGEFGEYAFVDVILQDGSMKTVITGAKAVLEALKGAKAANALPCPAVFVKAKRAWTVQ
ncbi:MAG: hypothetical protein QXJ23_10210 [Thermofilum sp.]|uniref:hypothetical protein n=1 Tax=Thermofilum sp. TaxID=1961369 RepID=UPI003181CDD6